MEVACIEITPIEEYSLGYNEECFVRNINPFGSCRRSESWITLGTDPSHL